MYKLPTLSNNNDRENHLVIIKMENNNVFLKKIKH